MPDLIRYDLLVQEALRSVVRRVLADAEAKGLPGEHHFYISFKTLHPGVRLSPALRADYPDEMTIVLQHQFWDLKVTPTTFEVGLSFKGVAEKLLVPFDSVSGFFDPSVQFGLKFEVVLDEPAPEPAKNKSPVAALPGVKSKRDKGEAKPVLAVVKPEEDPPPDDSGGGGQVVSLERFRKKK